MNSLPTETRLFSLPSSSLLTNNGWHARSLGFAREISRGQSPNIQTDLTHRGYDMHAEGFGFAAYVEMLYRYVRILICNLHIDVF